MLRRPIWLAKTRGWPVVAWFVRIHGASEAPLAWAVVAWINRVAGLLPGALHRVDRVQNRGHGNQTAAETHLPSDAWTSTARFAVAAFYPLFPELDRVASLISTADRGDSGRARRVCASPASDEKVEGFALLLHLDQVHAPGRDRGAALHHLQKRCTCSIRSKGWSSCTSRCKSPDRDLDAALLLRGGATSGTGSCPP